MSAEQDNTSHADVGTRAGSLAAPGAAHGGVPPESHPPPGRRRPGRPAIEALALVALCVVMFIVGLGDRGLAYSEGHRVGPAWEMLDAGLTPAVADAWLVPRLFGAPYLRKPPGMSWAIAASSALFGRNELAARLPSALALTVLVLVSWHVTTRWLGSPWGFAAGLAQAMFPFFWSSARSAEIEMLHAAGAGTAALLIADVMLRTSGRRWPSAIGAGIAICVMALAKGPAGAPVVLAAAIGVCLASRSVAPLGRTALAWVLVVPGLGLGATAYAVVNALDRTTDPVIWQDVGEFLWDRQKLGRILTLPAAAWGWMLPASLALLLVPWKRRDAAGPDAIARSLALAWLAAIALYTIAGVSNPRYVLPAATLLPPAAAAVLAGLRAGPQPSPAHQRRRRVGRILMLGSAWSWPIVLAGCFVAFLVWYERPRGRTSGDAPGAGLGAVLDPAASERATVWVDQLVECRPEVLLYARKWTPLLRVRWIKPLETADVRAGDVLIIRVDRQGAAQGAMTERDRCAELIQSAALIHAFPVHKYAFEVYRIAEPAGQSAPDQPESSPLPVTAPEGSEPPPQPRPG